MILWTLWSRKGLWVSGLALIAAASIYGWSFLREPTITASTASAINAKGPATRSLRGGVVTYIIAAKRNGGYAAYLSPSSVFTGDTISPAYQQANLELAKELIDMAAGEVAISITFAIPLDLSAAKALITEKGIRPRIILLLGKDDRGDKSSAGFNLSGFESVDEAFQRLEEDLGDAGTGPRGFVDGSVRVLSGFIPATPFQLGSLLDDPRMALVDVMEWDIRRDVRDGLGIPPSTQLDVTIPSPFWNLK